MKKKLVLYKNKKTAVATALGIFILVIGIATVLYLYPIINNNLRENRIRAIYTSFHLSDTYIPTRDSIFGDKRVYSWDKGRSYSSSKQYYRGANVDVTVADVKKAITDAGFTYFEEPYPGATFTELHFKSAHNEYVRLTVSSKLRDDAIQNKTIMGAQPTATDLATNPNAGPANVTIKVNLDDNNE
jgi:hypothetical protein